MKQSEIGQKIREVRIKEGLTQLQLAEKCNIDIRTIQRIESGEVVPRMYTLRIINEALGTNFIIQNKSHDSNEEMTQLRKIFEQRRKIRISLAVFSLAFLILVGLQSLNGWVLFGMPKLVWVPYVYVVMFAVLIGIAFVWRCPGCNAILGDVTNTRYCSKCGLHLRKE